MGIPAYFHPDWAADAWTHLLGDGPAHAIGVVVINPASGFGAGRDDAYGAVCARSLSRAGRTTAGYVDTAYASRPLTALLDEVAAYRVAYGLSCAFLDQVASGRSDLPYYRRLVNRLRMEGTSVILNPGVAPDPEYLDLAEVVVTFEGSWASYQDGADERRLPRRAATWHLVHSTPVGERDATIRTATARGASYVYVTERTMPNPWDRLPAQWATLVGSLPPPMRAAPA
jgi:hypothetical protein